MCELFPPDSLCMCFSDLGCSSLSTACASTDRLAYIFHEIGHLEAAHCARSESARQSFKKFQKPEQELAARREKRNKLKRELATLVPERAKPAGAAKAAEIEKQLADLLHEDKADEEYLSRTKRAALQQGYTELFDSIIEYGEKLALVARYGKVLTALVPTEKAPFPATVQPRGPTLPLWDGALKTAEVRAAVEPALKAYVPSPVLPTIPNPGGSGASGLGRSDTLSYGVSHRTELEQDDASHSRPADFGAGAGALSSSPTSIGAPTLPPRRVPPHPTAGAVQSPLPAVSSPPSAPDPSRSPHSTSAFGGPVGNLPFVDPGHEHDERSSAPPEPTVAETGIIPSGTGGPKTGMLRPRRSSSLQRSKSISAGAVAYLGPPGTYSHVAATKVFGSVGSNLIPTQSIGGAIDFVKRGSPGNLKFAVAPIENSTHGPVKDTVDALCDITGDANAQSGTGGRVYVIGETTLAIKHALLCGPKTFQHLLQAQGSQSATDTIRPETLAQVTNVFSHEQALGQCKRFLARYMPQARKKNVDSTAGAAVAALEFEKGTAPGFSDQSQHHITEPYGYGPGATVVAIGPETCAQDLGMHVLQTGIQDLPDNRTRFVVLASEPIETVLGTQGLPGSLSAFLSDKPGLLTRTRGLVSVFDALETDLSLENGQNTGSAKIANRRVEIEQVLAHVAQYPNIRLRKIDRRPAPFAASGRNASVWKSGYLVELETDGDDLDARRSLEHTPGLLGVWRATSKDVIGEQGGASSGSSSGLPPSTPSKAAASGAAHGYGTGLGGGLKPSGSSASGFSELATPGHGQAYDISASGYGGVAASGSSSSMLTDTTAHGADRLMTERERKEEEARREADEVRRHAEQARLQRQEQQAQLYGVSAGNAGGQSTLAGLTENRDEEERYGDEDGLPAYEPIDHTKQEQQQ